MYKFVIVTDPESAPGFRLAGADVREAPGIEEARALLPALLLRDDTGIVAVNEEFLAALDEKLMDRIEKTYRPIIIPIPSGFSRSGRSKYIERLLRRAIGFNIVVS
jgi:V/A-type H+-transporting ATPase subunit F